MMHSHKRAKTPAYPILTALINWQADHAQHGQILDKETPFCTNDGERHYLDAGWANADYWDYCYEEDGKAYPLLLPDFAVKICTSQAISCQKAENELLKLRAQGCPLGWLIAMDQECVHVFQPGLAVQQIPTFDYFLDGRSVLKGFEFPLRNLRY